MDSLEKRLEIFKTELSQLSLHYGVLITTENNGVWILDSDQQKRLKTVVYSNNEHRLDYKCEWDLPREKGNRLPLKLQKVPTMDLNSSKRLEEFTLDLGNLSLYYGIIVRVEKEGITIYEQERWEKIRSISYDFSGRGGSESTDLKADFIETLPYRPSPARVEAQKRMLSLERKHLLFPTFQAACQAHDHYLEQENLDYIVYLNDPEAFLISPDDADVFAFYGERFRLHQVMDGANGIVRPYVPRKKRIY